MIMTTKHRINFEAIIPPLAMIDIVADHFPYTFDLLRWSKKITEQEKTGGFDAPLCCCKAFIAGYLVAVRLEQSKKTKKEPASAATR